MYQIFKNKELYLRDQMCLYRSDRDSETGTGNSEIKQNSPCIMIDITRVLPDPLPTSNDQTQDKNLLT